MGGVFRVRCHSARRSHEAKKELRSIAVANRARKRQRQQLCVMAEVHRNKIRKVLKEATSISLALDEAKYRKIVRYRCDVPSAQSCGRANLGRNVGASGFSHSGVLGILDCSKKHASDFEADHAVTAMKQLDSFLTQFCTPLGPSGRRRGMPQPLACDHELKEHIAKAVTSSATASRLKCDSLSAQVRVVEKLMVVRCEQCRNRCRADGSCKQASCSMYRPPSSGSHWKNAYAKSAWKPRAACRSILSRWFRVDVAPPA